MDEDAIKMTLSFLATVTFLWYQNIFMIFLSYFYA